ncbi:MAG: hypothetical protein WA172_07785 [Terriglobales bacterium]
MKILLVHPDDCVAPELAATETAWDRIVDLGWSGRYFYSRQAERFGCPVLSIYDLLDHEQHRCRLRELLGVGLNQLVDSESIDWWDTYSGPLYQPLEQLMLASILAEQFPEGTEIFATRPHFVTQALARLLRCEIKILPPKRETRPGVGPSRFLKKISALGPSQMTEIVLDKWDADYRLRRLISPRRSESTTRAVLLPSAYVNVSRAQLAYARMLPERRFLLVVTRPSGRRVQLPGNVELRSLASYAPGVLPLTENERVRLLKKWQELQNDRFAANRVLGLATTLHLFDGFPGFLKTGLRVRDAWREVIANEPIEAVLSADEHNPFTRLPTLLARARKLPTVSCHHGALNMTFGIRQQCSDVYLASGEMAKDYIITWCGLPAEKILVGGPQKSSGSLPSAGHGRRDWMVVFSEAYEVSSARAQTLYSELLPELCSLARQSNRKVIVKLHPFENLRGRKAMIDKALSAEERPLVEMREGPMTSDLFERAWFSVTVESSVAVESTTNGVPCFLCSWFDSSWYDYGKQYAKFCAGYPLDSPENIRQIPRLLEGITITDATQRALHTSISRERLDSVLSAHNHLTKCESAISAR